MKFLSSKHRNGNAGISTMKKTKGTKIHGISCLLNAVSHKRPMTSAHTYSDHSISTASTQDLKFVSFAESVKVRTTINRSDYSNEERRACFYSNEENHEIQKKSLRIVEKMEGGCPISMSKYCTRGLEKHTRLTGSLRLRNRFDSLQAVLNEQERQRMNGVCDDEIISRVYAAVTSSCQLWAHRVALCDRREAERYMD
jgi:hypothetical protein